MAANSVSGASAVTTVEKPKALEHVKRVNPKTDKFEVMRGSFSVHAILMPNKLFGGCGKYEICLQVIKFHHIDWWCADASSAYNR